MSRNYPLRDFLIFIILGSLFVIPGCENRQGSIIDNSGFAPSISFARITPDTIHTEGIGPGRKPEDIIQVSFIGQARVTHPQGKDKISDVFCVVVNPSSDDIITSVQMNDSGSNSDLTPNDSIYSALVGFSIYRYQAGKFFVNFSSSSQNDFQSQRITLPLIISRPNIAPILSDLQCPSSVNTSTDSTFVISLKAFDYDGQRDIKSVLMISSSGKEFPLFDDGTHGDVKADNGIYTETFSVTPPPPPGPYLFKFLAIDLSSDTSDVLTATITIIH